MKRQKGIVGEIKKGTILVCIEDQATGCGIKYVKKDQIIKCYEDIPEYRDTVTIYRNKKEERNDSWKAISREKLRLADENEIKMYERDMYYVHSVNVE